MVSFNNALLRIIRKVKLLHALETQITSELEAKHAFSNRSNPPILIYQMGKVGSKTVLRTLEAARLPNSVLHLHFLSEDLTQFRKDHEKAGIFPIPHHIVLGEKIRALLHIQPDFPCKVITLVRDPIASVISSLFQNPCFAQQDIRKKDGTINPEKARAYLEDMLSRPYALNYVSNWFDRELKRVFHVDVFDEPFPLDKGYTMYIKDNVHILLIRLEDLSQKGHLALSEFLDLPAPLKLVNRNIRRSSSDDGKAYKEVLKQIRLDRESCIKIYSGELARHFYSEAMINQFISRWAKER